MMDALSLETSEVMVTICCITYNHEPYIRQCLDGFVMQKTNFRYEALVHDDASTDGTADIIREYAEKYPDIIKPIYQTENQYQKKVGILKTFLFPRAIGKYIAMCEGDDYWTDPLKLQKQVDFLEAHNEYVLCGHKFMAYIQETSTFIDHGHIINGTFNLDDLIVKQVFCSTLTVMFRSSAIRKDTIMQYRQIMDIALYFHLLCSGYGYCLQDVMAVYRIHNCGVWSGINQDRRVLTEFKMRLSISDVERNIESARFLKYFIQQRIRKKWILKHVNILLKTIVVFIRYFGFGKTCQFFFYFFLNKVKCQKFQ